MYLITDEDYNEFTVAKTLEGAKKYIAEQLGLRDVTLIKNPLDYDFYAVKEDSYYYVFYVGQPVD